jgi:hypothetical protein
VWRTLWRCFNAASAPLQRAAFGFSRQNGELKFAAAS